MQPFLKLHFRALLLSQIWFSMESMTSSFKKTKNSELAVKNRDSKKDYKL